MSEMEERVAEKLRAECLAVFGSTWNNDVASRLARAAIEAMGEPPAAMVDNRQTTKSIMSGPVVLIGRSSTDGCVLVVGLYATAEEAGYAVQHGNLPGAFYTVMTPALGSYTQSRKCVIGPNGDWLKP